MHMNRKEIELIIENMRTAGCSDDDVSRVAAMHEAGMEHEIMKCLRKCRCDLMEELHETQKRVDRIDHLIRMAQGS